MKIHAVIAVSGEAELDKLLRLGLPSLLSAGNLPAIAAKHEVSFKIYASPAVAKKLQDSANLERLRAVLPVDMIVDSADTGSINVAVCQDHAMRSAFPENAGLLFFSPHHVLSDGALGRVSELILQGRRAVLLGRVTVLDETFLPAVEAAFPIDDAGARTLRAGTLTPIAFSHLYGRIDGLFFDDKGFDFGREILWDMKGEGYIAHSWRLFPLFLHPHRIPEPALVTLEDDATPKVIDRAEEMAIIQDSGDIALVEIVSQTADLGVVPGSKPYNVPRHAVAAAKMFPSPYHHYCLRHPVRWHPAPIAARWQHLWQEMESATTQWVNDLLAWMKFFHDRPDGVIELETMLRGATSQPPANTAEWMAATLRVETAKAELAIAEGRVPEVASADLAGTWIKLVQAFASQNNYEDALLALAEILKMDPTDGNVWASLAWAAHETRRKDLVKLAVHQVRLHQPTHPEMAALAQIATD